MKIRTIISLIVCLLTIASLADSGWNAVNFSIMIVSMIVIFIERNEIKNFLNIGDE